MKRRQQRALLQTLKWLVLVDAAIFAITGVVCWVGGWRSWLDYSNGLFVACAAVLAFAIASAYGGWMTTSSFTYQYSSTASHADATEHARQAIRNRYEGVRLMLQAALICALPLLIAALIQRLTWPI